MTRQANTITIGCCGECGMVHIRLYDEDEAAFAEAIIAPAALPSVVQDMQRAAYEAAVEADPEHKEH